MENNLTNSKVMKMENICNVNYTKIPLHKRFVCKKPVLSRCLQPSFDTRWIRPKEEVKRFYFQNSSISLNERFASYENILTTEETNNKGVKSKLVLLYGILKRRNALLTKLLKLTISKIKASMNAQKLKLLSQKSRLEKNAAKKKVSNPLNTPRVTNSRCIKTKNSKEKLDYGIDVYMSRNRKLISKKYLPRKRNMRNLVEIPRTANSRYINARKYKEKLDHELEEYMSQNPKLNYRKYSSKKSIAENVYNNLEIPRTGNYRCVKARKYKEKLDHELEEYMSQKYFIERNSEVWDTFESPKFENSRYIKEKTSKEKLDDELDAYMSRRPKLSYNRYLSEMNPTEKSERSPLRSPRYTNSYFEAKKYKEKLDYDLEVYMSESHLAENNPLEKTVFDPDSSEITGIENSFVKTSNYKEWLDYELNSYMSQNPKKSKANCYYDDIDTMVFD